MSELNGARSEDSQQSADKFLATYLHAQDVLFTQLLDHRAIQNIYNCYPSLQHLKEEIQMMQTLSHS